MDNQRKIVSWIYKGMFVDVLAAKCKQDIDPLFIGIIK